MKTIVAQCVTQPTAEVDHEFRPADRLNASVTFPAVLAGNAPQQASTKTMNGTLEIEGAYSIAEFCKAHGDFTRQHFHSLIKQGRGPRIFKVGKRTLISRQAAAEWILKMEAMTADALHMAA